MNRIQHLKQTLQQGLSRSVDWSSLHVRLSLETGLLFILGLGSVATWTSWTLQQILISSRTQNMEYIATRFPRDVELYSEMLPVKAGLQKTINNITTPGLVIWVKDMDGKILGQSSVLDTPSPATTQLMDLTGMPLKPQVYPVGERYQILSKGDIAVRGTPLGVVYMALDVTQEQQQLNAMVQNLGLVCLGVTGVMMAVMISRIRRSLRPLAEMSRMTAAISAADLHRAQVQLNHAPSELKALAQPFNQMLERLSQSWEQQRQFVSNVSHELRTPLTIVQGYLQSLLRRSTNLTDYQREALETATAETERTVRLLQDLLDLARTDNGYMHFHIESTDLHVLLADVVNLAEKFSQRQIYLKAEANIVALIDRDRLKQVLINLIDNAVKYSEPDQEISLILTQQGQMAVLQVRDMGVGIPLKDQSRIFERFYRVDVTRTRSTGGHGLGLAIVKTLVEGMGGTITCQSMPNEGTTFTMRLPLAPASPPPI
jgi:heavy metal sensor kinase